MKKAILLTSLLALAACGGGSGGHSGGGAGTPGDIVTPTIPETPVVDQDSGLSMVDINKTRSTKYETAVATANEIEKEYGVNGDAQIARVAMRATARAAAAKAGYNDADIDDAYQTMFDILVSGQMGNATNHDILVSLALSGLDKNGILELIGYEEGNSDINVSEKLQDFTADVLTNDEKRQEVLGDIVKEADLVYKDLGKALYLDNAQFNSTTEMGWFTFVLEDGKITKIQQLNRDGEESGYEYKTAGNGIFETRKQGKEYSFEIEITPTDSDDSRHISADAFCDNCSEKQIREKLLEAALRRMDPNDKDVLAELEKWVNEAPIVPMKQCENDNGCIEHAYMDYTETVTIESRGKDLGLKYSDFGLATEKTVFGEKSTMYPGITYWEYSAFAGGYKDKEAHAPQGDATFTGVATVGVTTKSNEWRDDDMSTYQPPKLASYDGTAELTVSQKNGSLNQKLVADFSGAGWYTVTIDDINQRGKDTIRFDGKSDNADYAVTGKGDFEQSSVTYYGPDADTPTEATGFIQYVERDMDAQDDGDWGLKADIAFGVKKNK